MTRSKQPKKPTSEEDRKRQWLKKIADILRKKKKPR